MNRVRARAISLLAAAVVVLVLGACGSKASTSVTVTNASPSANVGAASAALATQATNGLALKMLARIGAPGRNVVFSPYSVQSALAMVSAGAAGQTASQIGRVLAAADLQSLHASNAKLAAALARATTPPHGTRPADAARLRIANGLFTQSGLRLAPAFVATLRGDFGAAPQRVDFRSRPAATRRRINAWVAARTGNRIEQLMPAGTITSQTALVLANAMYLRAHWSSPFDPASTAPGSFFTGPRSRVSAPFMTQDPLQLPYGHAAGYQEVELPYLDSSLSLLVVMPRAGTLPSFERSLDAAALAGLQRALAPRLVALRMPRFHVDGAESLDALLPALGMPLAFSDSADFSGITTQARLKISRVQHAADLTVDETGTVATAATGVAVAPTAIASPTRPVRLTVNHPFLVFLRDDVTGTILFAARVADPTLG